MKLFRILFVESNRDKHFLYAIPCGLLFGLLFVMGLASGMEFKDKQHGGEWDWLDWTATVIGGLIGHASRILLIWLLAMVL